MYVSYSLLTRRDIDGVEKSTSDFISFSQQSVDVHILTPPNAPFSCLETKCEILPKVTSFRCYDEDEKWPNKACALKYLKQQAHSGLQLDQNQCACDPAVRVNVQTHFANFQRLFHFRCFQLAKLLSTDKFRLYLWIILNCHSSCNFRFWNGNARLTRSFPTAEIACDTDDVIQGHSRSSVLVPI